MAWCPHCDQDRPIQRQTFDAKCDHCGKHSKLPHDAKCRGPVPGAVDVCTHCNTPVFAKAKDAREYNSLVGLESSIVKPECFVVTATMGNANHPIVCDMRNFRDNCLSSFSFGRRTIAFYERIGPEMARLISFSSLLRLVSFCVIVLPSWIVARLLTALTSQTSADNGG